MGTAVSAFRGKLGESLASIQRYDTRIEEATTRSLEALKAYSQGLRTRRTTGDFDSVPFFRRAIELDPEFALAYARLGTVYSNLGQLDEAKKMTTRAFELRSKVSELERYYIEARYFTTVENDVTKALDTYKVWLATYPNDYSALTNSALLHKQQGDRAEAVRKLDLATKVAPDQPLAWTNLAQTYFELGQYAEARRASESAIKIQDSTSARIALYQVAIFMGDDALAEQQVAAVRGRRDEADMVAIRMFAAAYRGRMNEAGELATDLQARTVALSRAQTAGNAMMQLAISEAMVGLADRAKARVEKAEDDGLVNDALLDDCLVVAAITRDAAAARAILPRVLAAAEKAAPAGSTAAAEQLKAIRALAALAEGKPAEAAALVEPINYNSANTDQVLLWSMAKLQAADYAAALKGLTFLVSQDARPGLNTSAAFAYARLGDVNVQLGQHGEARKHYERALEIFKNGDPDLPLIVETKAALAKLGS